MLSKLIQVQNNIDAVIHQIDDVLDAINKEEVGMQWLAWKMDASTKLLLAIREDLIAARTVLLTGGE